MSFFRICNQKPKKKIKSKPYRANYYPKCVMLQLSSRCNLSCWHCSKSTRPHNGCDISKETLDYVIRNILPRSKRLRIGGNGIGEALISENFNYLLSSLSHNNLKEILLVTNLTLLDNEKAELIAKIIDTISISAEGVGQIYSKSRNFSWDNFISNIELLDKHRKENKQSKLKMCLLVCVMQNNLDSLKDLFRLRKGLISKIIFREFRPYTQEKESEALFTNPARIEDYIKEIEAQSKETKIPIWIDFKSKYLNDRVIIQGGGQNDSERLKCYFPWNCISIFSSGNISCCCSELRLAQIVDSPGKFLDLWSNDSFEKLRKTVNTNFPQSLCIKCERYPQVKKKNLFFNIFKNNKSK